MLGGGGGCLSTKASSFHVVGPSYDKAFEPMVDALRFECRKVSADVKLDFIYG